MAEKNTISILQTIKNKLSKFDQKNAKDEVLDVENEFEYIAPSKNQTAAAAPETNQKVEQTQSVEAPKFEDDLGLSDSSSNAAANPMQATTAQPKEEGLEDFSFDSETTSAATSESSTTDSGAEMNEDDLEDYEDEVDFGEDEIIEEEGSDDDLDLDFGEETKAAEPATPKKEESKQNDDLNLDDLDFLAEEPKQEPVKKETKPQENHDDLNFDDLDLEEEKTNVPQKPQEPAKNESEKDDLEDLDLDFLDEKPKKETNQTQAKPEPASIQTVEKKEEDLDFEKEMLGEDQQLMQSETKLQTQEQPLPPIVNQTLPSQPNVSVMEQAKPGGILNETTIQQTSESIKNLVNAKTIVGSISEFSKGNAINNLAVQLMEPKLERWLNQNLPKLVEDIVREEIRKIIPKE